VGPAVQVIATTTSPPHSSAIEEVVALLTKLGNRDDLEEMETESAAGRKRSRSEADNSEKVSAPHSGSRRSSIVSSGGSDSQDHVYNVIVAVRQENILATAFHPELTDDLRWHRQAYTHFTYT